MEDTGNILIPDRRPETHHKAGSVNLLDVALTAEEQQERALIAELTALAKNKVAILIDDLTTHPHIMQTFLRRGNIESHAIKTSQELGPLVDEINKKGKEVFLIITDDILVGETGEQIYNQVREGDIPGLNKNTVVEVHSGGGTDEVDEVSPDNTGRRRYSKQSPENAFTAFLKRMRDYLKHEQAHAHADNIEKTQSFTDQLEYARIMAGLAGKQRESNYDSYIHDDRQYRKAAQERTSWEKRYKELAADAKKYGLKPHPKAEYPAVPITEYDAFQGSLEEARGQFNAAKGDKERADYGALYTSLADQAERYGVYADPTGKYPTVPLEEVMSFTGKLEEARKKLTPGKGGDRLDEIYAPSQKYVDAIARARLKLRDDYSKLASLAERYGLQADPEGKKSTRPIQR